MNSITQSLAAHVSPSLPQDDLPKEQAQDMANDLTGLQKLFLEVQKDPSLANDPDFLKNQFVPVMVQVENEYSFLASGSIIPDFQSMFSSMMSDVLMVPISPTNPNNLFSIFMNTPVDLNALSQWLTSQIGSLSNMISTIENSAAVFQQYANTH